MIFESIKLKAEIVEEDFQDKGIRTILNFGHTFGHAIEVSQKILHGIAVLYGIMFSIFFSKKMLHLSEMEEQKIFDLLKRISCLKKMIIDRKTIEKLIQNDKKKNNRMIKFVMIEKIGKAKVKSLSFNEIFAALNNFDSEFLELK